MNYKNYIILFIILFLIHLFVVNNIIKEFLFLPKINYFHRFILILFLIFISTSFNLSFIKNSKFYSKIYFISTLYLGFLIHFIIFQILNLIISLIIKNIFLNFCFNFFFPFLISIYSYYNSTQIYIEKEINLKFKDKKFKNTKICHLSDLHLGCIYQKNFVTNITNIIINNLNPDIIVITGDLCDMSLLPELNWFDSFKQIKIPILYITGNHEDRLDKEKLFEVISKTNIIHLNRENKKNIFKFNDINFIGFDFDINNNKIIENIKTDLKIVNKESNNNLNIILNHIPILSVNEIKDFDFDLFLCGHTHGGQGIPLNIITFFGLKLYKGLYSYLNKKYIYVNQGLGTSLFPMRFLSNSSISLINVINEK